MPYKNPEDARARARAYQRARSKTEAERARKRDYQRKLRSTKEGREHSRAIVRKYQASERGRVITRANNWRRWGINPIAAAALVAKHDGRCDCCEQPLTITGRVDHDHTTKKLRGILCRRCNSGIGFLGDDLAGVLHAVRYLRSGKRA